MARHRTAGAGSGSGREIALRPQQLEQDLLHADVAGVGVVENADLDAARDPLEDRSEAVHRDEHGAPAGGRRAIAAW